MLNSEYRMADEAFGSHGLLETGDSCKRITWEKYLKCRQDSDILLAVSQAEC